MNGIVASFAEPLIMIKRRSSIESLRDDTSQDKTALPAVQILTAI